MSLVTQPKMCFSIPASSNDNFYSQVAMFRLALDALGGIYKAADIILMLGGDKIEPLSDRWKPYFVNTIKLNWAEPQAYHQDGNLAQANARFKYNYAGYDIVIFCDADTIFIKPIDDLLDRMMQSPAVMGVMAHYHPFANLVQSNNGHTNKVLNRFFSWIWPNFQGQVSQNGNSFSPRQIWSELANQFIGKPIEFNHKYALVARDEPSDFVDSPFYINYGLVVTTPKIIKTIETIYFDIRPKIAINENLRYFAFSGQIALALSLAAHDIPTLELGLRYNFPNDPKADRLFPTELGDVRLIHYLNTDKFNRHAIFTNDIEFNNFLSLSLNGSNKILQEHVRNLTHGRYPFNLKQSDVSKSKPLHVKPVGKKVIVVLGMHRSGTSVISRGLQVLGVNLGDNLMPPAVGDNDKGYWEDIDLNALNIDMLRALNNDWHLLAPIQASDVEVLRQEGYIQRAIELLYSKTSDVGIFGFKDPRVAKLLPFWKEALTQSGMNVIYVIALRNPLSVAKSLARRDGFDYEKSSLLWLEHMISSLVGTRGENCVLVDYDRLIQSPELELKRLAQGLQLQIDLLQLEKFKVEFLDDKLRHSNHPLNDLMREPLVFPLVKEVYSTLLEIATDNVRLDDINIKDKIAQWNIEVSSMTPAMVFLDKIYLRMDNILKQLNQQDVQIKSLEKQINEIVTSKAWKVAMFLRQIRLWILPPRN